MKDLIEEHKPYVKTIKHMQNKFNDSKNDPLFNDGDLYEKCESNKETVKLNDKMNVLILIFDSTSFNHFKRIFPLTFSYLENLKNNFFFKNYNIVGKNSYPNMLSLFTGLHNVDNPDLNLTTENNKIDEFDSGKFEDFQAFIWKDYEKEKYLTMYSEDHNRLGLLNYLANGKNFKR